MAETQPGFRLLIENLQQVDAFQVFLPILLFLAIYYGLLKKTEAVGDDDAVIGVASIALSFITVFGVLTFVPENFFPQFFGLVSIVLIAILSTVLAIGLVGFEFGPEGNRWAQLAALGVGVMVVVVAAPTVVASVFQIEVFSGITITQDVWAWLTTLALVGVMGATVLYLSKNGE